MTKSTTYKASSIASLERKAHNNKFLVISNHMLKDFMKGIISQFLHMDRQDLEKHSQCLEAIGKPLLIV